MLLFFVQVPTINSCSTYMYNCKPTNTRVLTTMPLQNFRLNGELYDAVSIAEDDQWRRIRNILSPSFTSGRIKEVRVVSFPNFFNSYFGRLKIYLHPSCTSVHFAFFPLSKMFSIMKHHSRKLTASLQSKAHNDEVINIKA